MPLSTLDLYYREQLRYERRSMGRLIRAVNLGNHGKKEDLTRLLKELDQ